MVNMELLAWCLGAGSVYLLVMSLLLELLGRRLELSRGIAGELIEPFTWVWFVMLFVMEALFYVAIPTLAYAFFYFALPLTGVRAGMASALYVFTLGAAPVLMGLSVRVKMPMSFLLFLLLSFLLKIGGTLAIIGYLYSL